MRREDSTISMRGGLPEFWKSWPQSYRDAWMAGLKKRVNAALGFDLEAEIRKALKKLVREKVAEVKAKERREWLATIKRYDQEAFIADAMRDTFRRLNFDAAVQRSRAKFTAPAPSRPVARPAVPAARAAAPRRSK